MNQVQSLLVRGNNSKVRGTLRALSTLSLLLTAMLLMGGMASIARAQDQHRRKVPVLDKLSTGGSGKQAFTGSVKLLDLKGSVLEVSSARDGTDEYFPFKKNVRVSTPDGKMLTLDNVKPGWNVLLYYEEKDNGPAVKEIVVLGPPTPAPQKSAPPPSS